MWGDFFAFQGLRAADGLRPAPGARSWLTSWRLFADVDDPDDEPITIDGESLSETVIRERR